MTADRSDDEQIASKMTRSLAHSGLKALAVAVVLLLLLRGLDIRILLLYGLPPLFAVFFTDDGHSWGTRKAAWWFLAAIGVGSALAHWPQVFPRLGGAADDLSPFHDRLLTWYAGVYLVSLLGVLPFWVFIRNLLMHARGEPAFFSRFTCYLGLITSALCWFGLPQVLWLLGFWPLV
jgi:hypothetical protein